MALIKCRSRAFIILNIFIWCSSNVMTLFKMTNLKCESYNESWAVFKECRLRAINRGITVMNMRVDFLQPAYEINLNSIVKKKAIGGYKPFILQFDIDACEFVVRRNNPVAQTIYRLFKDFSNINHSCPYVGPQILDSFYLKHELFNLPMPDGDYALLMTWSLHQKKIFVTNVYFTFTAVELDHSTKKRG